MRLHIQTIHGHFSANPQSGTSISYLCKVEFEYLEILVFVEPEDKRRIKQPALQQALKS